MRRSAGAEHAGKAGKVEAGRLIRGAIDRLRWTARGRARRLAGRSAHDVLEEHIARMEADAPHKDSLEDDLYGLRVLAEQAFGRPAQADPDALHRTMFDLPLNLVEATVQMGLRRAVNARLMADWYRDRLVFLIASEKASSTLHEIVIRDMMQQSLGVKANFGIQRGLRFGPTELATEAAMHGLIPMYAPDGGVIRSPYLPFPGNVRYLNGLGCKMVLLTRHPADRIVARACMTTCPDDAVRFQGDLEAGTAFDRYFNLRSNSSLRSELERISGWLMVMGPSKQMHVARYEDMMEDAFAHFARIHDFLTGQPLGEALRKVIADRRSRTRSGGDLQPGAIDGRSYPRGYSGKPGVWRDYLAAKDIAAYNEVVRTFLAYEPKAQRLLELYPDLLLNSDEIQLQERADG